MCVFVPLKKGTCLCRCLSRDKIYKRKYDTMEEVQLDVFVYIELFYNRKRMHSHLGYMSPVEYRLKQMELSA